MYVGHIQLCFDNIGSIYKIKPLLHFTNKVIFAPTSYAKNFGSDERQIQFWLFLYPMLFFPHTRFKGSVHEFGKALKINQTQFTPYILEKCSDQMNSSQAVCHLRFAAIISLRNFHRLDQPVIICGLVNPS